MATMFSINGQLSPAHTDSIKDQTRRDVFVAVRDAKFGTICVSSDRKFAAGVTHFVSSLPVRDNAGRFEVFEFMAKLHTLINHERVKSLNLHGEITAIINGDKASRNTMIFEITVAQGKVNFKESRVILTETQTFDPAKFA